ncbi:uracil-DNA glycosylase [Megasphaera vaginalis (ex Bordigoni et al. 2020)]|uniref:uracil-DNA glycosylase n=1 Tax=Megasphaera vaginalis (ex Bordigoni et al. 2020) TaxID=2045301 RepID=UPI000C7BE83F|nr:uracil-DNA glycosylase [Megasphaera vaginalis (ex Bordigoni et al. 2020)]
MTITDFIDSLKTYHAPAVFNPWSDYDERCDSGPSAPQIRCRQLHDYLQLRLHVARYLLVAEAAGYQGCRFTGIAITCERMLLDRHDTVTGAAIIGRQGKRTSRPDCAFMTSRAQREKGMNEPTDTYVWGALAQNALAAETVILWNIFPFHPRKASPFTNRTPSDAELAAGLSYTRRLLALFPTTPHVGAIGRKAAETLQHAGIDAAVMRHPANGGASLFRKQFAAWVQETELNR